MKIKEKIVHKVIKKSQAVRLVGSYKVELTQQNVVWHKHQQRTGRGSKDLSMYFKYTYMMYVLKL